MSKFSNADDNNDDEDAKVIAIAIPQVFSENSRAKNAGYQNFLFFPQISKATDKSVAKYSDCEVKG